MIQRIALGYKYITPKGARRWSISCLFPIIPLQWIYSCKPTNL